MVNPTYLPDRHHLLVRTVIPEGSVVPKPDVNGDGYADTWYDCVNCHDVEGSEGDRSHMAERDRVVCHNFVHPLSFPGTVKIPWIDLLEPASVVAETGTTITVKPAPRIDHVTCGNDNQVLIMGSGFGSCLDAVDSGTNVTGKVEKVGKKGKVSIVTEKAEIIEWSDTYVLTRFSTCPLPGTVVVHTVFTSLKGPPPSSGGGKGGKSR